MLNATIRGLTDAFVRYWAMDDAGPLAQAKSISAPPLGRPIPRALSREIDALERASRHAQQASLWQRATTFVPERHKALAQMYVKQTTMSLAALGAVAGRIGRGGLVYAGTYTVLTQPAAVTSGVVSAAADAGAREFGRKLLFGAAPTSIAMPALERDDAAQNMLPMPGAFALPITLPSSVLVPPAELTDFSRFKNKTFRLVLPEKEQRPRAKRTADKPAPEITLATQSMHVASFSVDNTPALGALDKQRQMVDLPHSRVIDGWCEQQSETRDVETAARKLAQASARSRAQVQGLRQLRFEQARKAAHARYKANMHDAEETKAQKNGEPTVFNQILIGGCVSCGAVILGAALGPLASIIFVAPGAYLLMRILMTRTQQDAKQQQAAKLAREQKIRWLGKAHGHERWATKLSQMAERQASLWQQAGILSASARLHETT